MTLFEDKCLDYLQVIAVALHEIAVSLKAMVDGGNR